MRGWRDSAGCETRRRHLVSLAAAQALKGEDQIFPRRWHAAEGWGGGGEREMLPWGGERRRS